MCINKCFKSLHPLNCLKYVSEKKLATSSICGYFLKCICWDRNDSQLWDSFYWSIQQTENPSSFANQNFHFLSLGSSWCRIAHAFIPGGALTWSEAWKLKSQSMSSCQSIVGSYEKLHAQALTRVSLFDLGFSKWKKPEWPSQIICFLYGHLSTILTGHNLVNLFLLKLSLTFLFDFSIKSKVVNNFQFLGSREGTQRKHQINSVSGNTSTLRTTSFIKYLLQV